MANATISFNGIDLGQSAYRLTLLHGFDFSPSVQPRIDVQTVPYGGGVSQGSFDEVATLDVDVMVEGGNPDDLQDHIDNIGFVFKVDEDKPLILLNTKIDDRRWNARLSGMSQPFDTTATSAKYTYTFTMPRATAELITETSQTVNPAGAPHAFTIPAAGVLAGNSKAFPIYTFTASGAVTGITLVNVTQDITLEYSGSLAAGNILTINTDPGILSMNKTVGAVTTNALGNMAQLGFPTLNPRVSNSFTVLGANNTQLVITYRPRLTTGG